jgi:polysaccharide chain length determinant protein (PEP-CTERM system associated)
MQSVLTVIYDEAKRIWQYRWLMLLVACGVFVAGALYIERMPDQYYSWAQVYVTNQTTLSQLSEGVAVKSNRDSQVYLVRKTLLNDQNLEAAVRSVKLGMDVSTPAARESAKEFIRSHVSIRGGDDDGFVEIFFRDTNPVRARDVVRVLLNLFIASNLDQSQEGLRSAQAFLDSQIAEYGRKLHDAEQAETSFQMQHFDILGKDGTEGGFSARLAAAQAAVDNARSNYASSSSVPQPSGESSDVVAARARLAALRTQFTDQYPDVVAARRELDRLVAIHAASGPEQQAASYSNRSRAALDAAQARLSRLSALQAQAPRIMAQYAQLSRTADIIRTSYQALLTRREAARFSQALDRSDDTAHYRVTAEPQVPREPDGPDRNLFLLIAAGAALLCGIVAAYLLATVRGIFVAPRELEQAFDLPVVGTVSWEEAWQNRPRDNRFASVYFGLIALVVVASAAAYANGITFKSIANLKADWLTQIFR